MRNLETATQLFAEVVKAAADKDDEVAHAREDKLLQTLASAVIENDPHAWQIARFCVQARELEFSRWCA